MTALANDTKPRREGDLDVPDGLPAGIDLGRINNRDKAIAMYGLDFVTEMTDHALLGDDPAYRVMLEMRQKPPRTSMGTFNRALEHGIDAVEDPSPALVALFAELDRIPEWLDFDQLYRGAVAFWRAGPIVPPILAWSSIATGFSMYSSTRPVLFSGRLQDDDRVGDRLVESFRYIAAAYRPGGMGRFEDGFRRTAKVRMIHAAVRFALSRSEAWDWESWGIPINNLDSMHTQAGQFGWGFIDAVQRSGVRFSDREIEDITALSRYVGWVIGVPEEILHTTPEDALRKHRLHKLIEQPADDLCRRTIHSIIRFSVEHPPGDVEVLPAPVAKFMTTERRLNLAYGLLAGWQPAYVMEMMHVEKTAWWKVLPAVRPLIKVADRVGRVLPHDDEATAFALLKTFSDAIETPDVTRDSEVADADAVGADVAANRGGMPKVRRMTVAP